MFVIYNWIYNTDKYYQQCNRFDRTPQSPYAVHPDPKSFEHQFVNMSSEYKLLQEAKEENKESIDDNTTVQIVSNQMEERKVCRI